MDMQWVKQKQTGFTIVELLIVVVVIAILAAITIVAYNGIQTRAQQSKIDTDIATITRAIQAARSAESKTLAEITGSTASGASCWWLPDGTDLAALSPTHGCWTRYQQTLSALTAITGAQLSGLVDPWGRPYLIDENEGEGGGCGRDTVAVFKRPFTTNFGTYATTPTQTVPLSGFTGC